MDKKLVSQSNALLNLFLDISERSKNKDNSFPFIQQPETDNNRKGLKNVFCENDDIAGINHSLHAN